MIFLFDFEQAWKYGSLFMFINIRASIGRWLVLIDVLKYNNLDRPGNKFKNSFLCYDMNGNLYSIKTSFACSSQPSWPVWYTVLLYKTWRLPILKDRNNNIMQNSIPICDSPGVRENPKPRYWRDEQISQGLLSVVSVNADYKFITLAGRLWLDTKESAFRLFCQWDRTGKKKLGLRFLQTFDKKRCLACNCVETSGFRVKAKYKVTVCDENHYFFLYNWNGLVFSRFRQQKPQWRMKRKKKKNVTMWSKCMVWGSTPHLHNWFFLLWM